MLRRYESTDLVSVTGTEYISIALFLHCLSLIIVQTDATRDLQDDSVNSENKSSKSIEPMLHGDFRIHLPSGPSCTVNWISVDNFSNSHDTDLGQFHVTGFKLYFAVTRVLKHRYQIYPTVSLQTKNARSRSCNHHSLCFPNVPAFKFKNVANSMIQSLCDSCAMSSSSEDSAVLKRGKVESFVR